MTRRPPDSASPDGERAAASRPENHAANAAHGFAVIGLEERNRTRAPEIEPGDRIVLDKDAWVPAESLVDELEHVGKWPREHWTLAFQSQIRPVSERDATILMQRLGARAGAGA